MYKALILFITFFILVSPVSASVFVSEPSNEIITAPAASFTNSQLILSDKNPNQAVLNYLNGKNTVIIGDISLNGEKISADSVALSSKYWTKSDIVVLGTGQDVSAALVAIKNNAPLLIVGSAVPDNVNKEIQRLGAKKIIVCASPSSIPDSVLNQYQGSQRIWQGNDENTLASIQSGDTKIKAPMGLLPVAMTIWKNAGFDVYKNVTVNDKVTLWSSNDIITSVVMNSYANKNLPIIYIASDNLVSENADKDMLNKIKEAVSGSANVEIDDKSPKPGEGPRAIQNTPGGIAAYIAAADPGAMTDLVNGVKNGYLKSDAQRLNGIVYINYGTVNLDNTSYLPRAWDDNYSNVYFAGLYDPSSFLNSAGIGVIQPNVGTSSQDEEINKIASGLIDAAYSYNKNQLNSNSNYNSGLIGTHKIDPEILAYGSQNILADKKPRMGTLNWLYMTSQYVSGYPVQNTSLNFSGNISGDSTYFGVITIDEYREAGKDVHDYMEANKSVPNSVTVDGKKLNKADTKFLFAQLTYDHTSKSNMTFPKTIFMNKAYEPFNVIYKFIKSLFYQIFG